MRYIFKILLSLSNDASQQSAPLSRWNARQPHHRRGTCSPSRRSRGQSCAASAAMGVRFGPLRSRVGWASASTRNPHQSLWQSRRVLCRAPGRDALRRPEQDGSYPSRQLWCVLAQYLLRQHSWGVTDDRIIRRMVRDTASGRQPSLFLPRQPGAHTPSRPPLFIMSSIEGLANCQRGRAAPGCNLPS